MAVKGDIMQTFYESLQMDVIIADETTWPRVTELIIIGGSSKMNEE